MEINITIDCSLSNIDDQNIEIILLNFFQKYFKTLDSILTKSFPCSKMTHNPKSLYFEMKFKISDKQSIDTLKNNLESFQKKLNDKDSKEDLESELIAEALFSNLIITVDFMLTLKSTDSALEKINKTSFCELGTCFNKMYFEPICDRNNSIFTCKHKCDNDEYCKNDAACLPAYTDAYKPKCV